MQVLLRRQGCLGEGLGAVLRVRRLGWFVHVVIRDDTEILGKTQLFQVLGHLWKKIF